jgi:hypothetical protein
MQSRRHIAVALVMLAVQLASLAVATDILGADVSDFATPRGATEATGTESDIDETAQEDTELAIGAFELPQQFIVPEQTTTTAAPTTSTEASTELTATTPSTTPATTATTTAPVTTPADQASSTSAAPAASTPTTQAASTEQTAGWSDLDLARTAANHHSVARHYIFDRGTNHRGIDPGGAVEQPDNL